MAGIAVAGVDVYVYSKIAPRPDQWSSVLLLSFLFAVPLLAIAAFLRSTRPRTRWLAVLFAWLLFPLGFLAFIDCCEHYYPSSFGNFNFDAEFYAFITATVMGLVGFGATLAFERRQGVQDSRRNGR